MTFLIIEEPTNHYLVDRTDTRDGGKINAWYPDKERAIRFKTMEEALELFKEIMSNPKRKFSYKIIEIDGIDIREILK